MYPSRPPSLLYTSIPLPPPAKSPLFFSYHRHSQEDKFVIFATLPISTSTANFSQRTSSNILSLPKNTYELCHEKQVSDLIDQSGTRLVQKNNDLQVQDVKFETISDFNDLLMVLVNANELEHALKLYSSLSSFDLEPNCWTYSIIIRCYCKKKEPNEARRVVDQMFENGFLPNVATFTVLVNGFCRGGRVGKALEVMEMMVQMNCKPTIQTYNCLLKGLCYVGKVEVAYEWLMILKNSPYTPDIFSYTAVMDGFCKVGRSDEAFELLDEVLNIGLTPNVATFNTLLTGYFKEGKPLEGIGLLKQMKERNCMPDYISYSTLLHGLLKWGEIEAALEIYKEMVGIGFKVDERMMNTLLRGLCRRARRDKGLLKDAYQLFEKMHSWAFAVYDSTYELVIETFCRGGKADEALVGLNKMFEYGYEPKDITFGNVIRALCDEGKLKEALTVLVMHQERRIPSRGPFNILIDEFNFQGRLLAACNVYGAALKLGVIPERKPRIHDHIRDDCLTI